MEPLYTTPQHDANENCCINTCQSYPVNFLMMHVRLMYATLVSIIHKKDIGTIKKSVRVLCLNQSLEGL